MSLSTLTRLPPLAKKTPTYSFWTSFCYYSTMCAWSQARLKNSWLLRSLSVILNIKWRFMADIHNQLWKSRCFCAATKFYCGIYVVNVGFLLNFHSSLPNSIYQYFRWFISYRERNRIIDFFSLQRKIPELKTHAFCWLSKFQSLIFKTDARKAGKWEVIKLSADTGYYDFTHLSLFIYDLIWAQIHTWCTCLAKVINKTKLQNQDGWLVTPWYMCRQKDGGRNNTVPLSVSKRAKRV